MRFRLIRTPTLAYIIMGAELTRGMTTRDHLENIKSQAKLSFEKNLDNYPRPMAAVVAARDAALYEMKVTSFKMLRVAYDLLTGYQGEDSTTR